ncbi:hypothetical protein Tco_0607646 [Tanacetum coccineum]
MAAPTFPSSPPSPLTLLPQIPSPPLPLPLPPTHTSPTYAEAPLGYKVAKIQLRAASPPTYHPSKIPSSLLLLPSTTHRDDILEADLPLQKRCRFTDPTGKFEIGESLAAVAARQPGLDVTHAIGTMDVTSRRPMSREAIDYNKALHAELLAYRWEVRALHEQISVLQRQIQQGHDRTKEQEPAREPEPARDPELQDGPADAGGSC